MYYNVYNIVLSTFLCTLSNTAQFIGAKAAKAGCSV